MTFREQLLATLRAIQPVLRVPGVIVLGSEVPNLLQRDAAATWVVSIRQKVTLRPRVRATMAPVNRFSTIF